MMDLPTLPETMGFITFITPNSSVISAEIISISINFLGPILNGMNTRKQFKIIRIKMSHLKAFSNKRISRNRNELILNF